MRNLFLVILVLMLAGCSGGGSEGETATAVGGIPTTPSGPPGFNVATGDVTFSFVRGQTPLQVPSETSRIRFVFTTDPGGEGLLVLEETRAFAANITIQDVPTTARSVRVTALDGTGRSLLTAVAGLAVLENQTITVTFSTLDVVVATELTLEPTSVQLQVGGTRQFVARARMSDGTSTTPTGVQWNSTGSAALVDGSGLVTAIAPGTAQVSARLGTLSAGASVNVTPAPPSPPGPSSLIGFTLDRETLGMDPGTTVLLTAVGTFSNGTVRPLTNATDGLTYESSNESVAQVDDAGLVSAVAQGGATVTARVGGLSQSVNVTVRPQTAGGTPVFSPQYANNIVVEQGVSSFPVVSTISITDDQPNFGGGSLRLTLSVFGSFTGTPDTRALDAPAAPEIGAITGEGTREITVQLSSAATPTTVASFLQGVTASVTGPQGEAYLEIELDDGNGHTAEAYVSYIIRSSDVLTLTVDPSQPISASNYHNTQTALNDIVDYGADGSSVSLTALDFRTVPPENGNYSIRSSYAPRFSFQGANAGIAAGTSPQTRGSETIISSLTNEASQGNTLMVDGLTFFPNQQTSPDGRVGFVWFPFADFELRNCIFTGGTQALGLEDFFGAATATVEDCSFHDMAAGGGLYGGYYSIVRCSFVNLNQGLYVNAPFAPNPAGPDLLLQDCGFNNNGSHLQVTAFDPLKADISNNEFSGTGKVELLSGSSYSLDVRDNWWGQSGGPLSSQMDNQSAIAEILFTPFLTSDPLPSFP